MGVRVSIDLGHKPSPALVQAALLGLAAASFRMMQKRPLPMLYASGVRYVREPRGRERWQTAEETADRKQGDCEDLVAYRVAELWSLGERAARPYCYSPRPGLIHCQVKRADGSIEDPSAKLGMTGKG